MSKQDEELLLTPKEIEKRERERIIQKISDEGITLETFLELDARRKAEFKATNTYLRNVPYPKHPWGIPMLLVSLDTWQALKGD